MSEKKGRYQTNKLNFYLRKLEKKSKLNTKPAELAGHNDDKKINQ